MKIVVVVTDATHAAHVGGEVERYAKSFDAPQSLAEYVLAMREGNAYVSVSLALDLAEPQK